MQWPWPVETCVHVVRVACVCGRTTEVEVRDVKQWFRCESCRREYLIEIEAKIKPLSS